MITRYESDNEIKYINVDVYYFIENVNAHKFEDGIT